jgi:hypothetical protein
MSASIHDLAAVRGRHNEKRRLTGPRETPGSRLVCFVRERLAAPCQWKLD